MSLPVIGGARLGLTWPAALRRCKHDNCFAVCQERIQEGYLARRRYQELKLESRLDELEARLVAQRDELGRLETERKQIFEILLRAKARARIVEAMLFIRNAVQQATASEG